MENIDFRLEDVDNLASLVGMRPRTKALLFSAADVPTALVGDAALGQILVNLGTTPSSSPSGERSSLALSRCRQRMTPWNCTSGSKTPASA
jgi:hypothetical protein